MSNIDRSKKERSAEQGERYLSTLKVRFEKNMNRHPGVAWVKVQAKLEANAEKLWSLHEPELSMENIKKKRNKRRQGAR